VGISFYAVLLLLTPIARRSGLQYRRVIYVEGLLSVVSVRHGI